ncbi:YALIA101S02e18998g1_1 [Yarrowia lipolytica]|nr:Phosphorus acquisition-controlling protein [Yarrowia lipolytica]SEI32500.1 YALIA101S02e18998g1_1 [Yarrowia lipolytica]
MSELEHPDYANQMAEMNSFLNLHTNSPDHHQLGDASAALKRQTHSYPNSVSPSSPSVHSMSLVGTPKMNYDDMAFQKGQQTQNQQQGQTQGQGQQQQQQHHQHQQQGHPQHQNQHQSHHNGTGQHNNPHNGGRFEDYSFWNDFIDDDRNSPAATTTHNSHVSPTTTLPSQAKPQTHRSPANLTPPGQPPQKYSGNGGNNGSNGNNARYPFEMKVPGITPNEIFHSPLSEPMDPQNQNLANVYDDGSFTPLVSPAVSSFDPPMSGHSLNFAMPNAFLSLEPSDGHPGVMMQQQQQQYDDKKGGSASAPASATRKRNSVAGRAAAPRGGKARSGRATPVGGTPVMGPQSGASSVAGRVAKMSPMTRPTGRASARAGSLSGPNSVGGSPLVNPLVSASGNKDSWSSDSISPESLPDIVMPPPQTRSSVSSSSSSGHMKPATPSTLMDLPKGQNEDIDMKDANSALEDAIRVTRNLTSSRSSVSLASTGATPLMSDANISPNTNISSVSSTPQIAAKKQQQQHSGKKGSISGSSNGGSSSGGNGPGSSKIAPQPPSRRSSSVSASPAIMPKISPQIKPMMSEGSSLDYQTLLATKSNYQNIVEGKHNALGLQYPEHLSVNIASKRTSHKLAEQGRRNRINNALADLGKLLVPESASTSKANTVENAIDYIRKLKTELVEVTTKADRLQAFLQAKGLSDEFEATMGVLVKEEDKNWQGAES